MRVPKREKVSFIFSYEFNVSFVEERMCYLFFQKLQSRFKAINVNQWLYSYPHRMCLYYILMLLQLVNEVHSSCPSAQQRVWQCLLKDTFKLKSEMRRKIVEKITGLGFNCSS